MGSMAHRVLMPLHAAGVFLVFPDKSLHYIKERGAAGCPKYNSSVSPEENIKGPRGPNPVVLSAYEGYDEEEERAKVLSRWLIPREEWQTGNLEGKSEY